METYKDDIGQKSSFIFKTIKKFNIGDVVASIMANTLYRINRIILGNKHELFTIAKLLKCNNRTMRAIKKKYSYKTNYYIEVKE